MTNNRPVEGLGESSKNRPTPSPKGGVLFSFEPPIPLSVASCSGIETNESSYGSSKVRMNQIEQKRVRVRSSCVLIVLLCLLYSLYYIIFLLRIGTIL